MDRVTEMKRRRWADTVVLVVGGFVIAWAIWVYPWTGPDINEGNVYFVHAAAGALALASVFLALRSILLARALLLAAGIVSLAGLYVGFTRITSLGILTLGVPGVILLAMVPFIGPMPTAVEENRVKRASQSG
jgi:FtsH-binding integral membrane protein